MADIQVPPAIGTSGQRLDSLITNVASTIQRQILLIGDPLSTTGIAPVTSSGGMGVTILGGAASGSTAINVVGTSGGIVPATTSGGLGVTILGGAASGSTAINLVGSSNAIIPATSSGGLFVHPTLTVYSLSSGTVTFSSNPLVVVASSGGTALRALTSGTVTLSSTPLVQTASSSLFSLTSTPLVQTASSSLIALTSAPLVIVASSGGTQLVAITSGIVTMSTIQTVVVATSNTVWTADSTSIQYTPWTFDASSSASIMVAATGNRILYGWSIANQGTTNSRVSVYRTTAPTMGSTTDLMVNIALPANGGGNNMLLKQGVQFSTAITILVGDNYRSTSTALGHNAGDICGTLYYI